MKETPERTTLIAGFFVLIGLILLGTLIFEFGTLRHRLRKPYALEAVFMDAQNLIKGAPVKRAGATIGQVMTSPELVDGLKGVKVQIEIYPEFQIPVGSPLKFSSVGLLGDSLIDVGTPPAELLTGVFYKQGDSIAGTGSVDLTATAGKITDEMMVVLRDLRNGLSNLNITVTKLNSGVLNDENLNNFSIGLRELRVSIEKVGSEVLSDANTGAVKEALADFQAAMEKINTASSRLDGVLAKADGAMLKVDKAVDQLGPALKSTESATVSLKKAATALEELLKDARTGDGLLHALLNDPVLRKDITTLAANLRTRGFLWYKDKDAKEKASPPAVVRPKPPGSR